MSNLRPALKLSFHYCNLFRLCTSMAAVLFVISCTPLVTNTSSVDKNGVSLELTEKKILLEDLTYEKNIRSVLVYPSGSDLSTELKPAIISLGQNNPLVLEFDELFGTYTDYRAKILHCNADWNLSTLNELEYLTDFNDFPIRKYEASFNTKINFIHYLFEIPLVKISGNYIIAVYRASNPNDYILTSRFMVYENLVNIIPKIRNSSLPGESERKQQIDFYILNESYTVNNPREELKIMIRQNYRWDNALYNLKPSSIKPLDKRIEYFFFNGENNFLGYNEFRAFDAQSVFVRGWNISEIDASSNPVRIRLGNDKTRVKDPYFLIKDLNGSFLIQNLESQRGSTEGDYVKVYFTLKSSQALNGKVYILGGFNGFKLDNPMEYYPEEAGYQSSIILKQGYYNYYYGLKMEDEESTDIVILEGSHQATINRYEIFAYYRPIGSRADKLIGYQSFLSNKID